jgi:FKBP-type peptidyl-prolyl cis-trans isomerase 2
MEKIEKNYAVRVDYDCRLGDRGKIISRHKTYELARKAAKKTGFDSCLSIRDVRDYTKD